MTTRPSRLRARCLLALSLLATAGPPALASANARAAIATPRVAVWPGFRSSSPSPAVPAVRFRAPQTIGTGDDGAPATREELLAALARLVPEARVAGARPSLVVRGILLRPGDEVPSALRPVPLVALRVASIARDSWTLLARTEDSDEESFTLSFDIE